MTVSLKINRSKKPDFLEKYPANEMSKLKEIEIINQSKKDIRKFRVLYDHYFPAILNYVYQKVSNKDVASDITSHVFLKAMTNLSKYKIQSVPFSAWLYKIAFNETMLYFRKSKKARIVLLDEPLIDGLHEEIQDFTTESILQLIEQMVGRLNAVDFELITLRFYQNKSFRDIGFILGCTENSARIKSHRIIKKMKKELSKRNGHEEL